MDYFFFYGFRNSFFFFSPLTIQSEYFLFLFLNKMAGTQS